MQTKSPFLTGFSAHLCGRAKRSAQVKIRLERQRLNEECVGEIAAMLSLEIPPELIHEQATDRRSRTYDQTLTFWAFLHQVLSEDGSCAATVAQVQQWMSQRGLPVPSANTASYVAARQRLPEALLQSVFDELGTRLQQQLSGADLWRGHRVLAVDGTSAQMPDTEANQTSFPQPSGQALGCGFPVVQLIGLIDLLHGGCVDYVASDRHLSEQEAMTRLLEQLHPEDVLVADRAYPSYELTARLQGRGAHLIARAHQARKMDFRAGRKLGPNERLQVWHKPQRQPSGSTLEAAQWEALPEQLTMRIIRVKGPRRNGQSTTRYLVTTLLDPASYPVEEIASLYFHRWEIEVRFRDIKTTMGMELLRTKTPELVRKEILMNLIAYNAVRLLMMRSATEHEVNARRLSFKGALQVLASSESAFVGTGRKPRRRRQEIDHLRRRIAERVVLERPGRNEPRRVKRRPKCSRWMQQPRHDYPEHFINPNPCPKILDLFGLN